MDHRWVYAHDAEGYQQLVAAEDVDANLPPVLAAGLDGCARVVEVGAGTGRVTRILRSLGIDVVATEPSASMLAVAAERQDAEADARLVRAEAAALPLRGGAADAAVAAWVFGHQREWVADDWRRVVAGFIAECDRVTGRGPIVVVETLGTGSETPTPPAELVEYHRWLEDELGFGRTEIRTDYRFASVDEAATVTGRFFGSDFAETVRQESWTRVPECTGVWTREPRAPAVSAPSWPRGGT